MDLVGSGGDQGHEEGGRRDAVRLLDELGEGELAGAVDGHEQIELAFSGVHLGEVDVEEADRVGLELAFGLFFAVDLGQPGDAVALQAAVQTG